MRIENRTYRNTNVVGGFAATSSQEMVAELVFGQFDPVYSRQAGWPQLWLKSNDACERPEIAIQSLALQNASLRPLELDGVQIGTLWSDEYADYCLLAGVVPTNADASGGEQTISCLRQIDRGIKQAGMRFEHLVRTWFYLDHLLDWYDEFNVARTSFFDAHGVFERLIPASTGIGAANPSGKAVAAAALAVRPKDKRVEISAVESPLQCSATLYRSSFSRALEIATPGYRYLTISGTASIAPEGETLHVGDVRKQMELTFDVVEAILQSRKMQWSDAVRAVCYFRHQRDISLFEDFCADRGIKGLPALLVQATVCRDNLLFEMELDAFIKQGSE